MVTSRELHPSLSDRQLIITWKVLKNGFKTKKELILDSPVSEQL